MQNGHGVSIDVELSQKSRQQLTWVDLVMQNAATNEKDKNKIKGKTCKIYNRKSKANDENEKCPCGRLVRRHSNNGDGVPIENLPTTTTFADGPKYSRQTELQHFGVLENGCKFIRCSNQTTAALLYPLILDDLGRKKPSLIISVYGGAKYFMLTERLEKEFMRGIVDVATISDAWILTAALNSGVSKLVGEGISQYRLLRRYPKEVVCIGLTMWGSVNEDTRIDLKKASQNNTPNNTSYERQIPENAQEDKETLDPHHTHCILFDSGKFNDYLSDSQRSQFVKHICDDKNGDTCYSVTIIVEGGTKTPQVVQFDIDNDRPVVIIHGSGRMADVLSNLIELTTNTDKSEQRELKKDEIEKMLKTKFPELPAKESSTLINELKKIFDSGKRYLLHVFRLDRDVNIGETIFKAIFSANRKKRELKEIERMGRLASVSDELLNAERAQEQKEDHKLVNLALRWNYLDGAKQLAIFQKLAINDVTKLFESALKQNRAAFIDYFLRAGFDARKLWMTSDNVKTLSFKSCDEYILKLYNGRLQPENGLKHQARTSRICSLFNSESLTSIDQLDSKIEIFIGTFIHPIYSTRSIRSESTHYSEQEMLRDLFFWAVFMNRIEIAQVLLVHIRPRICAALLGSAILKSYAKIAPNIDMSSKLKSNANNFEQYAAICIDKCFAHNELTACDLLLRQIPLFGNITCMQVAISSESMHVLETACFHEALNHVWFDKLATSNDRASSKPSLLLSVVLIGLPAPLFIKYREKEDRYMPEANTEFKLSKKGINYYLDKDLPKKSWTTTSFIDRFVYFHQSPMVKMCYHFLFYCWFLLVFSYMMLYEFELPTVKSPHWTEIYIIITVSTMLSEEFRQLRHRYVCKMSERQSFTGWNILTALLALFKILPYALFYTGIGVRYGSGSNRQIFTAARILLALDLETWYLQSLKFVIALKSLGPKLFMLKNMLPNLFEFLYIAFVAIAAYGVVSRSLFKYNEVSFDGKGIFGEIFYRPYWFLYGQVSDTDDLDQIINNTNSTLVAEAIATHVLLAFHMLFINILLLNLLIAVFTDTIGKVQHNTEFYWHYQRYSFVREYFDRPILAYPPLIIFPHLLRVGIFLWRMCRRLCRKSTSTVSGNFNREDVDSGSDSPVLKMIAEKDSRLDEHWDMFENAATYSYARSSIEQNKKSMDSNNAFNDKNSLSKEFVQNMDENIKSSGIERQQETNNDLKEEIKAIRSTMIEMQIQLTKKNVIQDNPHSNIDDQLMKMNESLAWIMDAMERVKMNSRIKSRPDKNDSTIKTQPEQ